MNNAVHVTAASRPAHRVEALETIGAAAALLYKNGQTTERVVLAAERLGRALGVSLTLHPHWGEIALQVDGAPFSEMIPAAPLGVDMGKVLAVMTIADQACDGVLPREGLRPAVEAAARTPVASTARFTLFAALGAASLGVIFGALDVASLQLIAFAGGAGALFRRWLAKLGSNPFIQPLCAAAVAGLVGAAATRFHLSQAPALVALCPCMILVPGPHILNGAIDLARTRITLGVARLTYAGLIALLICAGLLLGLATGGESLADAGSSTPVPLAADVIAAGIAVAAFGTFFSLPGRMLPFPIALGMAAHAVRWALISLAGAQVATGALVACALVGVVVAPVADRLRLPFAALGFCAVVSMMPGFFLFRAAGGLFELVSLGQRAPAALLAGIAANAATAFLIVLAMTFGLILPRVLFEQFLPAPETRRAVAKVDRPE